MNQSTLSVRINKNDKENFEKFCSDTGMNVSTAINMFIKTVIREQKLPFEIKSPDYDKLVYEKLKEAENELKNGVPVHTSKEVFDSLNNIITEK